MLLCGFYTQAISFAFPPAFMKEARIRIASEWQPDDLVATRALLREAGTRSFDQQLDVERDTQSQLGRTHDYIEGVSAFLQKRPAQFTGN